MSSSSPSPSIGSTDLQQKVWNGVIPVQIVLAAEDCRNLEAVEPLLMNAPRLSYFPIFFNKFAAYFSPYLRDPDAGFEWWLEFQGVPLRWNWPIGLLYDLLTGLDPGRADDVDHDWHLPWTLILHKSQYPADTILRITSLQDLKDHWINRVKEADYLRRGNANAIMNLSKTDSLSLWEGVETYDFEKFWSITKRVLPSDSLSLKSVPIKIYLPSSNKMLQALVSPTIARREVHTLGTALNEHLPELFPSRRICILARPVLHGVLVSLTVPLTELLYECMYTDGFLHICIAMIT